MDQGAQWAAATAAAKQHTAVKFASFFVPVNMNSTTGSAENISRGTALYVSTLMRRFYPSLLVKAATAPGVRLIPAIILA
jgi:hypothetical protein